MHIRCWYKYSCRRSSNYDHCRPNGNRADDVDNQRRSRSSLPAAFGGVGPPLFLRITILAVVQDKGVQHHWKWDAVMRTIVHDNRYRALSTLPERKQAFSKWAEGQVERERERKRAAFKKQEEDFLAMLEECDAIKYDCSISLLRLCSCMTVFPNACHLQSEDVLSEGVWSFA